MVAEWDFIAEKLDGRETRVPEGEQLKPNLARLKIREFRVARAIPVGVRSLSCRFLARSNHRAAAPTASRAREQLVRRRRARATQR